MQSPSHVRAARGAINLNANLAGSGLTLITGDSRADAAQKVVAKFPEAKAWLLDRKLDPNRVGLFLVDGTRAFLEVSTEPCFAPAPSTPPFLMVRDRFFDENGIASGSPGEWRPLPEGIEGYTPRAGEQHVVRVKRFEQAAAAGGEPTVHFVLDLIIETRTVQ